MFIEPTITWVPSGFSGYIWLDTKIVFEKKNCFVFYATRNGKKFDSAQFHRNICLSISEIIANKP